MIRDTRYTRRSPGRVGDNRDKLRGVARRLAGAGIVAEEEGAVEGKVGEYEADEEEQTPQVPPGRDACNACNVCNGRDRVEATST